MAKLFANSRDTGQGLHFLQNIPYSLEAPLPGITKEFPQHMFPWTSNKNISTFLVKKKKKKASFGAM